MFIYRPKISQKVMHTHGHLQIHFFYKYNFNKVLNGSMPRNLSAKKFNLKSCKSIPNYNSTHL